MSAARVYELLLRAYPREYVTAHGDEVLATLEEATGGRFVTREAAGLLAGSLRQRQLLERTRCRDVSRASAAWLAVLLLLGWQVEISTLQTVQTDNAYRPQALGWLLLALPVFALALRGRARPALAIALVPLLLLPFLAEPGDLRAGELGLGAVSLVSVAALAAVSFRRGRLPAHSWWWLALPLTGSAALATPKVLMVITAGVLLLALAALLDARLALATAGLFATVGAGHVTQGVALGIGASDLAVPLVEVGIGAVLLLRALPILVPRRRQTA